MLKPYHYLLLICLPMLGCINNENRYKMLQEKLTGYKQDSAYAAIQAKAKNKLNNWIAADLEGVHVLKECDWKLDDAVFFNSRKDRAYLLLLIQDNLKDAELDYVYVMYAALEKEKWTIYFAGLPNLVFPRNRFGNKPIPFSKLSELGKQELLKGYLNKSDNVDDAFVEHAYTEDLKAKQLKFLANK